MTIDWLVWRARKARSEMYSRQPGCTCVYCADDDFDWADVEN